MPVFELKYLVVPAAVAAIEQMLAEREEERLMVIEERPAGHAWVAGYFSSAAEARATWAEYATLLRQDSSACEPSINELADQDWQDSYKQHFKAWKFDRLNWVPIWEQNSFQLPAGEEVLWLDPGMAFGTGNHETTRLVVERLVDLTAKNGVSGRVIDAGCGSGILALSAAKLGYTRVVAFDNDPLAIDVSRANAALNGVEGRVSFMVGDLVTGLAGRRAELALANIQSDVLMKFADELLAALAPGGVLVLSGILAAELDQVAGVFSGIAPAYSIDSRSLGEWADLVVRA